ncbi:FAD-dependent oxidoreductase [Massilia sp. IC2-278]|uniref:flavin monoamine oxidase family protein n=1 Tax=Massilia sp. IC2-278 TaxID=2887200 RepID=UPI001E4847FF|nr:FAD-dependent oxidoreductase [Massilia sp. IC2-278]MCC2959134.1 FAD-dependent oxidoreductase [Massilia sp. IC2-278]
MKRARIAIIGGGLAGLYAASLLEQHGVHDYVLLEARGDLGGRILSVTAGEADAHGSFDLGPTWFWPTIQPQLDRLVRDLGLERFAQYESGDMLVEHGGLPIQRMRGYINAPPSMRLPGGMAALIGALRQRLVSPHILAGHVVREVRMPGAQMEVNGVDAQGASFSWQAEHLLLALPPRLATQTLAFDPPLPPALASQWHATATWMAPHAKYVAVYASSFWREYGLSGEARSGRGPMAEIHDASLPGAGAALFGFLGIPAQLRATLGEDALRTHCRAQLVRLFGEEAGQPVAEFVKDWAADPFTATASDLHAGHGHGQAPDTGPDAGPWVGRLAGIGSEWSPQFPGYLAGAIEAAEAGVTTVLAQGPRRAA